MESITKQLVNIGHGMSKEIAEDEPAVAKLLVELSSALDVQYERGNALEARCAALAAENAGLNKFIKDDCFIYTSDDIEPRCASDFKPETTATDAFLAEVRAQGVDEFLRGSQLPYQIATVLADYDNVDDATLQTVIWSGQPPEPDGDVWHLEYVSRGNAIVRAVLKELRKGVQQ